MHEDYDDRFDRYVRSMMEDAEEEVPSGVWEAIEPRIPQTSTSAIWWKRLGLAVVACAVIVSAIILPGKFNSPDNITVIPQDVHQSVAQAPAIIHESAKDVETEDVQIDQPHHQQTTTTTVVSDIESASEMGPASDKAEVSAAPSVEESTTAAYEKPEKKPADVEEKPTYEKEWSDYIAKEEHSQRVRIHKFSADILGAFGANDNVSNFSNGTPGRMSAPTILGNADTGIIESGESVYSIPVTFGVGVRYYFTSRFSAGIGVNYSLLTRTFTGTYQKAYEGVTTEKISNADVTHTMSYIGIPLNLYFDILQTNLLRFYALAGGTGEKSISNKYRVTGTAGEANYSESVKGLQWSAALGLGIQFNLSEHVGLYLDPEARYYFNCNQPKNIRTQKPFMFNIEAGIRFNL